MKQYNVDFIVWASGVVTISVDAENEDEAIKKASKQVDCDVIDYVIDEIEQTDIYEV